MKFATIFLLSTSLCAGVAQTNLSFQDCQIGDTVKVKCEQSAKERQDDPQYEKQVEILRDFVRRSEAGEKFNFGQPVQ